MTRTLYTAIRRVADTGKIIGFTTEGTPQRACSAGLGTKENFQSVRVLETGGSMVLVSNHGSEQAMCAKDSHSFSTSLSSSLAERVLTVLSESVWKPTKDHHFVPEAYRRPGAPGLRSPKAFTKNET